MNRRFFLLTLLLCCLAGAVQAGSAAFVVAIDRGQPPVAVTLEVPADYVAVPLALSSSEKDPLRNIEQLRSYTQRLQEAVAKSPGIRLRQGTVSLAVNPGEEGGFSSFKVAATPSSASLYLVAPLPAGRDLYQAAQDLVAFAQTVVRPESLRVSFGSTVLGIEAPERLRPRLLALIQQDLEQVRAALGHPRSFVLSGLESALVVLQRDDRNLTVYLPYRLQLGP